MKSKDSVEHQKGTVSEWLYQALEDVKVEKKTVERDLAEMKSKSKLVESANKVRFPLSMSKRFVDL